MDEMSIADESPNNPLKVLHSQLDENSFEKDEKKKIAFIGISNWSLDASKMNRAINKVIEDPDEDYLQKTAKGIIADINPYFENFEIIKPICKAYLSHIKIKDNYNREDFYGFRDFYSLIKYISDNDNCLESVVKGIYRNFGGFENSEKQFLDKFFKEYNQDHLHINYNVMDRIKDNIESKIESRYLLLITDNIE